MLLFIPFISYIECYHIDFCCVTIYKKVTQIEKIRNRFLCVQKTGENLIYRKILRKRMRKP